MCMLLKDYVEVKQVIILFFFFKVMMEMVLKIDEIVKEIVDEVVGKGSCEFVFDVVVKFLVFMFCELMGIFKEYCE